MDDSLGVQSFQAKDDLSDETSSPVFTERTYHLDQRGQVTSRQVLHNEEEEVLVLCRQQNVRADGSAH
jgi:hypothetical protein